MKLSKISAFLGLSIAIVSFFSTAANSSIVTKKYQSDFQNFPNPERGFSISRLTRNESEPLNLSDLQYWRSNGVTLIRRIYLIPSNSNLSQSFLNFVKNDLETARKAGVKLFIRFTYNWDSSGTLVASGNDASTDRIISHLDQLKPILQTNFDAIAFMQAGFIGSWGEWHSSTNGLDTSENRKTILNKVLSVLPNDRMVALRFPLDKMDAFSNKNSLTPAEAFDSSYRARTGAHNDCFLYDSVDGGTFYDSSQTNNLSVEGIKDYLNLDNRYVVQGGETCAVSSYSNCPNALKELERLRWSYMEIEYEQNALQRLRDQGCIEEIGRSLGYRFRLTESTISDQVKPGDTFSMTFKVTNDGWASPYNPRSLEVILRNRQTGKEYYLPVAESVRLWMPGETKEVKIEGGIPADIASGEYQVLLHLPDPTSTLYGRSEYSIRLANQDVWEADTGYNTLGQSVNIESNAVGDTYSGSQFFQAR